MINKFRTYLGHPMMSGSLVMVVGANIANFIAYLYHLIFGRLLGPSLYSELAVVVSIIGLIYSILWFFNLVIVKYTSSDNSKNSKVIYTLITKHYNKRVIIFSAIVTLILLVLASSLGISESVLVWCGFATFFIFGFIVHISLLQGGLKFYRFAFLSVVNLFSRLVFGLILYYSGFSVAGISFGIALSYLFTWIIGKALSNIKVLEKEIDLSVIKKELIRYALPVFVMTLSMYAFISLDLVLVKYYFDPYWSGIYSSLSALGKIVYYGALPVTLVMFPLVAKKAAKKKSTRGLLCLSIFLTTLIGTMTLLVYWLLPSLAVNTLFGDQFLDAADYLVSFGVFSLIYTLNYLFVNYYLAIGKVKAAYLVPLGLVMQVVGIILFHQTFTSVIFVSITVSLILLILLILFGLYINTKVSGKFPARDKH